MCALAFWLASSAALAQLPTEIVFAVGKAAGTDLKAQDKAKQDAKRNAVAEACGQFINAQTEVENFELIKDRILADAVGYITNFKVRREWEEDGISFCEIQATVAVNKFEKNWQTMFVQLKEDVGNPRCMIIMMQDPDVTDDKPADLGGVTQSRMQNYFLKHDMLLVDKDVTELVRDRDIELAAQNKDLKAMAARAAAFNADLLVFGRAQATPGGASTLGGSVVYKHKVAMEVSVVQADSAQILASNSYTISHKAFSPFCGDDAFEKIVDESGTEILKDVSDAWKKRLSRHQIFQVVLEGLTRNEFRRQVTPALIKVRGVQQDDEGVKMRGIVNDIVTAEIYWAYDLDTLADELEDLAVENMAFEIVEQSANRIRAKVVRN
jgi:hypothetical protein